jgi:glucose/arabinose dehydrogenase
MRRIFSALLCLLLVCCVPAPLPVRTPAPTAAPTSTATPTPSPPLTPTPTPTPISLSIEGGGPGHNVCGVNLPDGRILVLDNEGFVEGYFNSLAEVARHYIAKGWMWEGGSLRTIRASQITQITTDYTTPKVTDLPWSFHNY